MENAIIMKPMTAVTDKYTKMGIATYVVINAIIMKHIAVVMMRPFTITKPNLVDVMEK
jgi:hypothetical protein